MKLGLYVFHHNNNFNLINIYSSKTLMFCFANFFVAMLRVQIFLCPFGALQIFFTNSSTPSLPPPTRSTGQSHKDSRHEVRSSSKCTPPPAEKAAYAPALPIGSWSYIFMTLLVTCLVLLLLLLAQCSIM